jgi:choline dehydrogenase-like flavoprotein
MARRDHREARGEQTLSCDVVIVGTGPGGAAAGRVIAQSGRKVIFLEEGPATPRFRPNLAQVNRYHMQEGGVMVARSRDAMLPIAAGRGVGGGSLVNSAICWRTPDPVLSSWTEVLGGDDRYRPAALGPVFDEIEAIIEAGETPDAVAGENNRLIVRGAAALGLPGGLLRRNTPRCQGCGICNYGCPVGGKASVDQNLMVLAEEAGAVVQADVKVDTVLVSGDRAAGVEGDVLDTDTHEVVGRLRVEADTVFVCAGGVGTPRLLHHTGLADRLGPALGRGLHVHPGNAVLGRCDHIVQMWAGATQGAWFEHPDLPGVLPHTLTAPPGALLLLLGKVGLEAKASLKDLPYLCGCVVMISDHGEGTVSARSDGRADLSYTFHPDDVQRIKDGMVQTARVLLAGGARSVFAPVHAVGEHTTAESFAEALSPRTIRDFTLYASHPMASCRMGTDPKTSVIGPSGEAHGLKGLFLADSSIFPTSLGVNPQLTTMVMATAIARRWVAQR